MANLYGRLKDEGKSNATEVTRTAGREISAQLETWEGGIRVELDKDGNFKVFIGPKYGERAKPDTLIAYGNVDGEDGDVGRVAYAQDGDLIVEWR